MKDLTFSDLKKANSMDFLRMLRSSQHLSVEDQGHVKFLQQKTIKALVQKIYGAYKCLGCGLSPDKDGCILEGHHAVSHTMYISSYRHCSGFIKRHEALDRLENELRQNVIPLCKTCHELAHHQPHA